MITSNNCKNNLKKYLILLISSYIKTVKQWLNGYVICLLVSQSDIWIKDLFNFMFAFALLMMKKRTKQKNYGLLFVLIKQSITDVLTKK